MSAARCPYCGWEFTAHARHKAERVLPYCSHGCKLAVVAAPSKAGQSFVTLEDAIANGELDHYTSYNPDEWNETRDEWPRAVYMRAALAVSNWCHNMLMLTPLQCRIVCMTWLGGTGTPEYDNYEKIAQYLSTRGRRLSRQYVERVHRDILDKWPSIRNLYYVKVKKQEVKNERRNAEG